MLQLVEYQTSVLRQLIMHICGLQLIIFWVAFSLWVPLRAASQNHEAKINQHLRDTS